MIYCYRISMGLASLHKMHDDGNDVDQTPKKIGRFKTDKAAKDACILHHERACKMARAAGRAEPKIMFM